MPKIKRPGTLFVFFILLLATGLIGLLFVADDYFDYTASTIEAAASIAPLNKESELAAVQKPRESFDTEVKYRKFFVTAPNAQKVSLAADFNRWGKDPIDLKAYRKGYFETSVALTGGEYKYVFVVDGQDMLDPTNKDRTVVDGREVCIKTVR